MFFVSDCDSCKWCSICSVPRTFIKFFIIFMFVEFLIKKFLQSFSARTGLTLIHHKYVALGVANNLLDQVFICLLHQIATQHSDERYKHKQNGSFLSQPEHTIWVSRYRTLRIHLGVFLWKQYIILAFYKGFCKLQNLFMYSFTHTNIVFLSRHLPTQTIIFINVCYQTKCFISDSFYFLGADFANIPLIF